MNNHPALDRMALPPPSAEHRRRAAFNREAAFIFTPTAFVISVIVATVVIAMLITVVTSLPETARIVLVATGLAGLLVFRMAALYGGWDPRAAVWADEGRETGHDRKQAPNGGGDR